MNLTPETKNGRTVLRDEDGLHVGSIIELDAAKKEKGRWRPGTYQWITAGGAGYCDFYEDAEDAILGELER